MKSGFLGPARRYLIGVGTIVCLAALGRLLLAAGAEEPVPPEQSDIDRNGQVGPEDLLTLQRDWHKTFPTVDDLIPRAVGNYWRYRTFYQEYGPEPGSEASTMTITILTTRNTTSIPGYTSTVFQVTPFGESHSYLYTTVSNGAFLLLGEGTIYPGPATVYQTPEIWVQGPALPGRMWMTTAIQDTGGIPAISSASIETIDAEVVTDAGTFTQCVKVIRSEIGTGGGQEYHATEFTWFKPGIGPVKAEIHRSWTSSPAGQTSGYDWSQNLYQYNLQ